MSAEEIIMLIKEELSEVEAEYFDSEAYSGYSAEQNSEHRGAWLALKRLLEKIQETERINTVKEVDEN